jgi:FMN phosphatase YigB (HAD superfamily)
MIQAILFDLDDTLLENNVEQFLPAYLQELGSALSARFSPEKMIGALMSGTRAMMANCDPEITLQSAFDAVFYPLLAVRKEVLESELTSFYSERFPRLQRLTRPMPGAREAMEAAFRRNARVAVATNPLFPRSAVRHRIQWAGLESIRFPFDLVTSYEFMHFSKPRPEFIAEALALLACSPENALFIGNDGKDDIAPARKLGVETYQVLADGSASADTGTMVSLAGQLSNASDFWTAVKPDPSTLGMLLMGNLAAIAHLLRTSGWRQPPTEEGWGAVEIACHLRDFESEILQPRLRLILSDENPYLAPVSSDAWPVERDYAHQNGEMAVRGFCAARRETISMVSSLAEDGWVRTARHAVFGPTTLAEQVRFVARHDLLHIEQLRAAMAACDGGN